MPERSKKDDFAEKAYAAAAAEMKSGGKPDLTASKAAGKAKKAAPPKPVSAPPAAPKKKAEDALALPSLLNKSQPSKKAAALASAAPVRPVPPKAAPVEQPATIEAAPAEETAAAPQAEITPPAPAPVAEAAPISTPEPTNTDPKDTIMATAPNADNVKQINDTVNNTMTTAMSEIQTRAKAAYEKGTETAGEVTEFAKGNVEAVVESTKIFAAGVQDLGRTYVEEARTAYETMSADVKEMAAIKSPTELFQLQGKIVRRNLDAMIATSSKNTEALMKLANEAFAPLTGRVNVAAEKLTKGA